MKGKFIIILLLLIIIITGCKENLTQVGELLYKNPNKLKGEWKQSEFPVKSNFILVTEDNVDLLKEELRGVKGVKLNDKLGIYVSLGEQSSGGYLIQINQIRRNKDNLFVVVKAIGPSKTDIVTQVITYPMDIVTISKDQIKGVKKVIFLTTEGDKVVEKSL